ncbi:MAG TPA: decaprenyl-phosphate phosphoribosyltransferase [Chloroflexota bacterium]|nr:decaprenyl-phosphate phosphoribosyltransferase [Chloroflexota bacterium]
MSAFVSARRAAGPAESLVLLLRSMRPRQWPKNGVVLFGLVFALELGQPGQVLRAVAGTLLFCLLSGAVYLFNDLRDVEKDRLHPRKRTRPIASGRLAPAAAAVVAPVLAAGSAFGAYLLSPAFGLIAAGYLALQALYVLLLKEIVILDVLALSLGFVLRAAAGAVVVGVPISPWLYVCALLLALFLSLGKRRQELVSLSAYDGALDLPGLAGRHRPALEHYTVGLLDQLIQVVTTCLVVAYSLYTFSAENLPRNHAMMLTVPFVLYGLFRYLYLVHVRGEGGAPEEILLRDPGIAACVALWGAACVAILYLSPRTA